VQFAGTAKNAVISASRSSAISDIVTQCWRRTCMRLFLFACDACACSCMNKPAISEIVCDAGSS
jgi:hypothetical protein